MGRRNNDELENPAAFEVEDAAVRRILAQYDQSLPPVPPNLVGRTLAALPPAPAGRSAQFTGPQIGGALMVAVFAVTLIPALVGLPAPTDLTPTVPIIGAADNAAAQATLALSLATKPLLNLLTGWGWIALLLTCLVAFAGLWWVVVRMTPPEDLLERRA